MTGREDPESPAGCPNCGSGSLERVRRTAETTFGSIGILAEGVPVDRCACGLRAAPASFAAAAATAFSTSIPVTRGRRLRSDACVGCAAGMSMPVRRSVRAVTVSPEGGPVTTLHLDLPLQRCPDCGLDHLPARSRAEITAALTAVIDVAIEAADPFP